MGEKDDYDSENSWISDGSPAADPFRHIEILYQKRARSVAAHSENSVLFRPHAEI